MIMKRIISVAKSADITSEYVGTPIGLLLEYQNLAREHDPFQNAPLLIGMCMDNRKKLNLPDNFAFIIRTGGGNMRHSEFKLSYAIAIGGVTAIALLAHNNCGMVNLFSRKREFINGLVRAGWDREWAEDHFNQFAPMFEIGNEIDFVLSETKRLRLRYPKILVAPLYYNLDDNLLYQIQE